MKSRLNAEIAELAENTWLCVFCVLCVCFALGGATRAQSTPVIVVETSQGTFEIETYPNEAPKTVAHVTLADRPDLNGKYAVFGRVVTGEDVPARLERGDLIRRMYLKQ